VSRAVPAVVAGGVALVLATGAVMIRRSDGRINKVALASTPQPVAVVRATSAHYRASRSYGGTFVSWVESGVGPQILSAYVDTVLVRPGASVRRGDVLATLDCRNPNTSTQAVRMEARAVAAQQRAIADQTAREVSLLDGGFIPVNQVEQEQARSAAADAELASQQAKLAQMSLAVNDCVLRAPFDGEVSARDIDPGAFVRPGASIVTLVDRTTVRLVADAPETDFGLLEPGTTVSVRAYATGHDVTGVIARRSPGTDPETRTVHFEIDVRDPGREIPSNTTGEVHIQAGEPVPATEVPLYAALVRGDKATVFVLDGHVVRGRTFDVKGESGGSLFLDTSLAPGTAVVVEGRELLQDGDLVAAAESHP
jgi:membrane fusion protein (multidrug efflux system)